MPNRIAFCLALPALAALALCACAPLPRHPGAAGAAPLACPGRTSPLFELLADGVPVPVLAFKDVHYAQFIQTRPARIEVRLKTGQAQQARVQPTPYAIAASVAGGRVTFDLPAPKHVVVQIDHLEKLFLFAEPPPEPPPAHAVSAASAGAVGDGLTDNTAALQAAIDALPPKGALVIPSGHFRTGSLALRSDMTLHLAPGALLQATDDYRRIRPIPGAPSMIAFLVADGVTNLAITGYGTLDANGFKVRRDYERAEGIRKKAGRALFIRNGRNVAIRGITVRDSYSWNVDAQFTDDLTISNLKILSDVRLSNHDGIDLESCRNVQVSDCFIFSEDDGLSPKARAGRDTVENHTFRNCVIWAHKANGIRIGSESDCRSLRNMTFENIYILNAEDGIRLDTTEGAVFENILFRNVWMEDFLQYYDDRFERNRERRPIHLSRSIVLYVNRSEKRGAFTPLGRIRNVAFENVHWNDARVPAYLMLPDATKTFAAETGQTPLIEKVRFSGCTRAGRPIRTPADAGFPSNDASLTAGFTFN